MKDGGRLSDPRLQMAGISQGCPLSLFLFVMLMSVLMADARASIPQADQILLDSEDLAELLYADDTLLLSVSARSLERCLQAVSQAGGQYGLQLHWGKLQDRGMPRCIDRRREAQPQILRCKHSRRWKDGRRDGTKTGRCGF